MHYLSTDHLIVGGFLLLTLLIGLWAGRGIKDFREYAIANKRFGTGALTITLLATYIGGWDLFLFPGEVFAVGISFVIPIVLCGVIGCLLFIAWFIAPKMMYFKDCLTMGDLMHSFYGKHGRMITGVVGLVYNTTAVSIQILFLSYVCEFLGISSDWGLSLAALILVIYTAKGGMQAVTITDILQFIAITAAVPLLAHLVTYQAGGIRALLSSVPQEKLQFFTVGQAGAFNASYYSFAILILWFLFPGFPLSFPFIQRMLMAKHERQAANMYYISTAFLISFFLLLTLIGLAALVVYPQIEPQDVLLHLVTELPEGLKGLVWTALLAVVMSTTDSFLHAAGVSLTHDLIKPLLEKGAIAINELRVVKYTTLLIGCLAIVIALAVRDLFKIAIYGMDLAALLFTIPLIAGIMGLKTEARSFLIALFSTLTVFTLTKLYLGEELAIPICILVNALSFFGAHYFHNQGFAVVKRATGQPESYVWQPSWEGSRKRLASLLPTPQKLLQYSQEKVAKYGTNPTLFALFMAFSYMVPFFMHSYAEPVAYNWLLAIRGIGALLCVGLLFKSQWPAGLLPYFPSYYHFCLLYCLPFVTTFLFLLEGSSIEWLLNVALSIMLLIVLADWVTFVGLSILGIVLAMGLYKLGIGPLAMRMDLDTTYTLVYAVTFFTLIGLTFARRKQQRVDKQQQALKTKDAANQASLLQVAEERFKALKALQSTGVQGLLQVARDLQELPVEGEAAQQLHTIQATLIPMAFQLQGIDTRAQDYLRLQVASVPIKQWLTTVQEELREKGIDQPIRCQQTTQHKELVCDPERLTTLLIKSIAALGEQAPGQQEEQQPLLLGLEDTWLHYPLPDVAKGYVKKVKALRMVVTTAESLPALAPCYWPDLTTAPATAPENTQVLEQQANERIIKAHYGYAEVAPNTLLYVIPIDVKELRPKDMDKRHMELGEAPVRANDHYKSDKVDAQAQEKEFLAAVAQRSRADIGLVKTALELIKWYHGPMNRHSGEPFYVHPLTVAQIVLDYNTDQATILGALLHDTVEDTMMFLQHIGTVFGEDTAGIVDVVTHLQSVEGSLYKIKLSGEENLRMLERTGNTRGLYVKLADRMHNMWTIGGHSSLAKQKQIAQETMAFFVPLAKRLGLHEVAQELAERSREVLSKG